MLYSEDTDSSSMYILWRALMFWEIRSPLRETETSAQMQKSCTINDTIFLYKSQYISCFFRGGKDLFL